MPKVFDAAITVLALSVAVSLTVRLVHRAARRHLPAGVTVKDPAPAGWVLGLLESFLYFVALSMEDAALIAAAWLAFKLATRWKSATWAKPTEQETQVGYRAFQVGTVGTLLAGAIGAAIYRL